MNIVVCVKQVIDPEAPPASFKVDAQAMKASMTGVAPVLDPYGEYAVEAALKIKDATGAKVTVISLGANLLREVVKKPLSMGADDLILLEEAAFEGGDSYSTAAALAAAIRKLGDVDLVLTGRECSDTNAGQVGGAIAEILNVPVASLAKKVEAADGMVKVQRITTDGYDELELTLPAVVTVSNEVGEARYPTIKGIMTAKKKDPIVWSPADIGAEASAIGAAGQRVKMQQLFQPVKEGKCEIIEGQNPEEAAANLATRLREVKVL